MNSTIQTIRKKLYLAMDGANSSSMRKKGLDYKFNFGVPVMTLRKLAKSYFGQTELANALWKENTRELMILATLIQDPDHFTLANEWVQDIKHLEIAEQACMNLFSQMNNAGDYAHHWTQSSGLYIKISGFLLYGRLFMAGHSLREPERNDFWHAIDSSLADDSLLLKTVILNTLKKLGKQSVTETNQIINRIESLSLASSEQKQNISDELRFELESKDLF